MLLPRGPSNLPFSGWPPFALVSVFLASMSACSCDSSDGGSKGSGGSAPASAGTAGSAVSGASNTTGGGRGATGGTSAGGAPSNGGSRPNGGGPANGGTAGSGTSSGGTSAGGGAGHLTAGNNTGGALAGGGGAAGTPGATTADPVPPVISAGVRWIGRVDVSDASAQKFAWSGTGFVATVTGDTIAVKLKSDGDANPVFFQPVIDGMTKPRVSVATADGEKTVTLGTGLGAGDHVVELYRETEGKPGFATSAFLGFATGTPKDPPAYSGRLIEVIGDSISAGYGNLGSEQHPGGSEDPGGGCRFSNETESAYLTYGAIAARAVNADASILAASGWGVYWDNQKSTTNVLGSLYANTVGGLATPAWPFTAKPHAVVINLGTNDFSADMSLAEAPFSTAYKALIATVREKYPKALIFCAIGPLLYGAGLTNARAYINAVVTSVTAAGDKNVKLLDFGQQDASKGTGCDWHPNVAENQRMGEILARELRMSLGW